MDDDSVRRASAREIYPYPQSSPALLSEAYPLLDALLQETPPPGPTISAHASTSSPAAPLILMSFKFKLGEIVVPTMPARYEVDIPRGPSEVTAIQLRGYIQITPVGTTRRLLVKADDYERFEEKTQ